MIFILLEGDDDERFFNEVLSPLFRERFSTIKIWKYAQRKAEKVVNILRSIKSMNKAYLFLADYDDACCITKKKEEIKEKFDSMIEPEKLFVVIREIESWYLSGLSDENTRKICKRKRIKDVHHCTKEEFGMLIPTRMSRVEFMQQVLKSFDIETARKNNSSFDYLIRRTTR